jgi:hypothetical protein
MLATTTPAATIVTQPIPDVSLRTLQALIADLAAQYPAAGPRVEHAAFILAFRQMERSASGTWYVESERERGVEYIVTGGQCNCQDFQRHGDVSPCKHQLATMLHVSVQTPAEHPAASLPSGPRRATTAA